ncbi:MAG TPA: HEPN domain-containing protein [Bacillales bacterium]|nr:HEPN domain-containing protein [Bacillales bacterium]
MDNEEKYLYWIDIAEYDLKTADIMCNSGRYVYVAFMCQQALEKLAKGLYNYYIGDKVPRVHNISFVLAKVLDHLEIEADEKTFQLFDKLAAYYIEGRYPTFKEKISVLVDKKEAKHLLKQSKEAFKWMKSLKK